MNRIGCIVCMILFTLLLCPDISPAATKTNNAKPTAQKNAMINMVNINAFMSYLPEYMTQFKAGPGIGDYSYRPGSKRPDLYGTTDMVYLLYTLNKLDSLQKRRSRSGQPSFKATRILHPAGSVATSQCTAVNMPQPTPLAP